MANVNKPGPIKKSPAFTRTYYPPGFARKRSQMKQRGIQQNLLEIQKYGNEIRRGFRYIVFRVIEIAVGMDFDARIIAAARDALSPIDYYNKSITPFDQFADRREEPPPFFVGALLELLPSAIALRSFRLDLLDTGKFIKAGKSLLCFSSAEKAGKFIRALQEDTHSGLNRFLKLCQRDEKIQNYMYRRYQMDEVLELIKKKPRGFPQG